VTCEEKQIGDATRICRTRPYLLILQLMDIPAGLAVFISVLKSGFFRSTAQGRNHTKAQGEYTANEN